MLRTIARLDGTPFPSTAQLAWRWVRGRVPRLRRRARGRARRTTLETAYCAEVVAVTYEDDGPAAAPAAGRTGTTRAGSGAATTSGCPGYRLGDEIAVDVAGLLKK